MITEHILFYPHNKYNLKRDYTDELYENEFIQYGYVKKRDIKKWENNELVAVKMGMLSPRKKGYSHMTILSSALRRIEEQDSTSCFEDEDELIPVYVFVSKETDREWREYLKTRGFVSSRQGKNREGMLVTKSDVGLHYGKHYGYDTKEVLSEKEEKRKRAEEERIRKEKQAEEERIRIAKELERARIERERLAEQRRIERENAIYEYEVRNGANSYNRDLLKQKQLKETIVEECTIDEKTLALSYVDEKTNVCKILSIAIFGICMICYFFCLGVKNNPTCLNDIYVFNILAKISIFTAICGFFGTIIVPLTYKNQVVIFPNGETEVSKIK